MSHDGELASSVAVHIYLSEGWSKKRRAARLTPGALRMIISDVLKHVDPCTVRCGTSSANPTMITPVQVA